MPTESRSSYFVPPVAAAQHLAEPEPIRTLSKYLKKVEEWRNRWAHKWKGPVMCPGMPGAMARYGLGQHMSKKDKKKWLYSPTLYQKIKMIHRSLGLPCWVLKHYAGQGPRHIWTRPSRTACLTCLSFLTFIQFLGRNCNMLISLCASESKFVSLLRCTVKKLYESVCLLKCVYWFKTRKAPSSSVISYGDQGEQWYWSIVNIFQPPVFLQVWPSGWMLTHFREPGTMSKYVLWNVLNYRFHQEMGTQ